LRVQDIMDASHPFLYVGELATKARAVLRSRGSRILPVLDERKRLVGMISRGDVMTITSSISPIRVEGIMSKPRFVATLDMDVFHAVREMIRLDEWYIPVVKSSQDYTYMGVLGLENFIGTFLEKDIPKLTRPLSEIMSTEVITCSPEDEVDNIWRLMQERSFAGLPVVSRGKLIGIVTQKNLLDSGVIFPAFEAKRGRFKAPPKISSVMKAPVVSLRPTAELREAAELMLKKNIGRVPIVDREGRLVGMVDREDIVRALL